MKLKKMLLISVGLIALLLGTIGIILPILPTTPFVLLAAGCFSLSSPGLTQMLRRNQYLGSYIDNYMNKTGVPKRVKIRAIIFLWVGLAISIWLIGKWIMTIVLIIIGSGVTIHLVKMKSKE